MEEADDIPFHCILCSIRNNAEIFPSGYSSSSELLDLFGIDLPSQLALLPTFETRSKLSNLPDLNDFDMDENLIHTIDSVYHSEYYEIPEFSKLNHAVKGLFGKRRPRKRRPKTQKAKTPYQSCKTKTQKPKTHGKCWKMKTQKAKTPYQKLENKDPET